MKTIKKSDTVNKVYIAFAMFIANPSKDNVHRLTTKLEVIEKEIKKNSYSDKDLWFRFFKDDNSATTIKNIFNCLLSNNFNERDYLFDNIVRAVHELSLEIYYS
jgi:hypothetical protein